MLALQLVVHVIFLIEFTYYFKHIFIQYISVHLYKGPDFIPDRGPKIASPPLIGLYYKTIIPFVLVVYKLIVSSGTPEDR